MRAPRTWRHYHHPTFDFWITTLGLPTTSLPVSSQVLCHQTSGWNWKGPAQEPYKQLRVHISCWRDGWDEQHSKVGGCKAACSKAAGLIHVPGYCNPQHRCGWRGLPACSVRGWQHRPTLQRPSATTWARPSSSAQHFFFILQVLLLLKSRGTSNITDRKGSFWKSSVMPFSPNSVSTLRGSYGKCKGRCLIRVLTLGASLFPAKFPSEVALVKCWHAFWLRRLAQSAGPASGARHFSCKFPCKVALAKCWSAFRLGKVCVRVLGSFWSVTFYLYISI